MPDDRAMVTVDANALKQILEALLGPAHLIREIQMTHSVAALTGDDPIGLLLEDYSSDARRQATPAAGERPNQAPQDGGLKEQMRRDYRADAFADRDGILSAPPAHDHGAETPDGGQQ